MTSPTHVAALRAGIKAAIETIFQNPLVNNALNGTVPNVYEGKTPDAWFLMNLPGTEAVVFSYAGQVLKARGPISRRDRQEMYHRFSIACTGGDWAVPVGAIYQAADVAEYLMGSSSLPEGTPNLRTSLITKLYSNDIYLRFVDQGAKMAANSTVQGGRSAIVSTWETFPEIPQ